MTGVRGEAGPVARWESGSRFARSGRLEFVDETWVNTNRAPLPAGRRRDIV